MPNIKESLKKIIGDTDKLNAISQIIEKHDKLSKLYKESEKFFKRKNVTTLLNEYRYALRSFVDIFAFDNDFDKDNDPYIRTMQSLNHIYCDLIDVVVIFAREEFEQLAKKYDYNIIESVFGTKKLLKFLNFLESFKKLISESRGDRKKRTQIYMQEIGEKDFPRFFALYEELFKYENLYLLDRKYKGLEKNYNNYFFGREQKLQISKDITTKYINRSKSRGNVMEQLYNHAGNDFEPISSSNSAKKNEKHLTKTEKKEIKPNKNNSK